MVAESPESILAWTAGWVEMECDDRRLAELLRECELQVRLVRDEALAMVAEEWADAYPDAIALLKVPGDLYDEAIRQEKNIGCALFEALDPNEMRCLSIEAGPSRSWSNQAGRFDRSDAPRVWQGMRFRSYTEQVIAEALDRANLDFQPNCLLRSGDVADDRRNIEPDFVIYAHGRIGVLEVDGEPWHPPERAAFEHQRDRRLRGKGWIVERFDAEECRDFPDQVVAEFLRVMRAQR